MSSLTPPHPQWRDGFLMTVVPIAGLVTAIAAMIITYQVARISDLASDIKNVNGRVDQIYPLIAKSTSDMGYLKANLETTTQKLTYSAEANDSLTRRIDSIVASQESYARILQSTADSVRSLTSSVRSQQQQLEDIKGKTNFTPVRRPNKLS